LVIDSAKKISILFQNFNLLPSWTAGENVEATMLHTGINRQQRNEKISALLAEFGLRERMEHLPCELSIGQQQMVALARAIVNEPAILLADEPSDDVDPQTAQELVNRLVLLGRNGTTIIVATHGNFPLDVADRCFLLEDGRIKACG
jgi:putative ABC transport system ATP-binding protein